jgi:hypothetical protein
LLNKHVKIAKWLRRTHFICQHRCFRHYSNLTLCNFLCNCTRRRVRYLQFKLTLLKKITIKEHINITISRGQQPALYYYALIFARACDNYRVQYKATWDRSQSHGTCVCRKLVCMLTYERSGVIERVDAGSGKTAEESIAVIKMYMYILFPFALFLLYLIHFLTYTVRHCKLFYVFDN